ncbi:MAG TPA: U32 family peptidase [Methanomicrobia archaeon]|nr:U32 family peptidase [Methanomicrobia archaeon]
MPTRVELLSPVGSPRSLQAAVENGADAVYFGVGTFNARRRAENFTMRELRDAVSYAHEHGVKVYLTFNILVKNDELPAFFDDVSEAYSRDIDGVIIQHLSFAPLLKDTFPDLRIHSSTQAAVSNSSYADLLPGVDRVTLPRELSLAQVRAFIKKTAIETEVFVHGALCFSYSGLCLFSSFLGGRSGNRGLCAQPCRKSYNGSYRLSTKDLCLVRRVPELIAAGIASFKIEGRLRSPRYTALATRVYRLAVDSYYKGEFRVPERELKELALEFNRDFTEGYLFDTVDLIAPETPRNRGLFLGVLSKDRRVTLHELLAVGDGIGIWTKAGIDGAVIKEIELDGKSVSHADRGETVQLAIRAAAGDTIYKTSSTAPLHLTPLPHQNPKIAPPTRVRRRVPLPELNPLESDGQELLVKVYSKTDAEAALEAGATRIFYSIFADDFAASTALPYIPRILADDEAAEAHRRIVESDSKAILLGNLGLLPSLECSGALQRVYLEYSANIFNDLDVAFVHRYGAVVPVVSPELTLTELSAFRSKNFAVLVHGRPVLMTTKYPLPGERLEDERGFVFPVRREFTYTQILNSLPMGLFNEVQWLCEVGITKFFLDLTDGNAGRIIGLYRDVLAGKTVKKSARRKHTRGHFTRGVQ